MPDLNDITNDNFTVCVSILVTIHRYLKQRNRIQHNVRFQKPNNSRAAKIIPSMWYDTHSKNSSTIFGTSDLNAT